MQFFEVGGFVRDEIMGVKSKDIDFTCVLDAGDFPDAALTVGGETDPFKVMRNELTAMGFKIFVETPEFLTIRAKFPGKKPKGSPFEGDVRGLTADFVLARKESDYTDGRRPDRVEIGTLEDDLARRDFSMNAIAKDSDGSYIDPFNGRQDIANQIIRAVGDPMERLREDSLRAVRALRFSVTKEFRIENALAFAMESSPVLDSIHAQSDDRIRDELSKMLRFDSVAAIKTMGEFPFLTEAMLSGRVSLDATMKQH